MTTPGYENIPLFDPENDPNQEARRREQERIDTVLSDLAEQREEHAEEARSDAYQRSLRSMPDRGKSLDDRKRPVSGPRYFFTRGIED